ncbi:unnamed protein product [Heterobilharzia americana]|nr:unnamed protein product [Heterobilharzia americana]
MDGDVDLESITLVQCSICGRHFREDIINRHQSVCLKSTTKKRKAFDSVKQRIQAIPVENRKPVGVTETKSVENARRLAQVEARKHNWRQRHEEFIQSIRAAKEYTIAKQTGKPLPPPPPPTIDPNLIQSAERHIMFCREKHSRIPANNPTSNTTSGVGRGHVVTRISPSVKVDVPKRGSTNLYGASGSRNTFGSSTYSDNHQSLTNTNSSSTRTVRRGIPQMAKSAQNSSNPGVRSSRELGKNNDEMMKPSYPSKEETTPTPNRGVPVGQARQATRTNNKTTTHLRNNSLKGGVMNEKSSKFCFECGSTFPSSAAKFCPECGVRRMGV